MFSTFGARVAILVLLFSRPPPQESVAIFQRDASKYNPKRERSVSARTHPH